MPIAERGKLRIVCPRGGLARDYPLQLTLVEEKTQALGTPIDLARLIEIDQPHTRVHYNFQEKGTEKLEEIIDSFIHTHHLITKQWEISN